MLPDANFIYAVIWRTEAIFLALIAIVYINLYMFNYNQKNIFNK